MALSACRSTRGTYYDKAAFADPVAMPSTLQPGSEVEVRFFYTPQLDTVQVIRPDGGISMQLVGDIDAAGRTPMDLEARLKEAYKTILRSPEISVVVRSYVDHRVLVGGAVRAPGPVDMQGQLTVLEALLRAGGPDFTSANIDQVIVIRKEGEGRKGYSVDLGPALSGEDHWPFYLRPEDVVFVPRTRIARLDQWVDQYVNQLVPRLGLNWSRRIGNETFGVELRNED